MSSKNNILFVNTNKEWGGGEKWHLETALYLKEQGYKVILLANTETKLNHPSLNIIHLRIGKLSFLNPFKIIKFISILKRNDISSAIVNLPQDFKFVGVASFFYNFKSLIYRRGMPHPLKNSFINKLLITKKYTSIIANSEFVKKSLLAKTHSWFPFDKIKVIYNGVSSIHHLKENKKNEKLIIGNAGRLVSQKGQIHLIELASRLKEKNFPFIIKIAGTGPLESELKTKIKENKLDKEVILLGHVEDMPSFYKNLDVFVFPSYFEGQPNALIEAMSFGLPCIGFNMSSIGEVIENNYNGFLVDPFDVDKIANLILSEDLLSKKENAQATVIKQFLYEENIKKLIPLL